MFFKNLCILVLWMKIAIALEGLVVLGQITDNFALDQSTQLQNYCLSFSSMKINNVFSCFFSDFLSQLKVYLTILNITMDW